MTKPILFSLDDDPQVLRAIARDLKAQYRSDYRIRSTDSPSDALEAVVEFKKQGEIIALFLVDQRMPNMLGVEFLRQAKVYYPDAKTVLLTAYSDTDAAIQAINDVQLDYYLTKPWDPPQEKLYPVLDDLLDDWQMDYRPEFKGIRVLGYQYAPHSHEIKDFLSSNLIPYEWVDVQTNTKAESLITLHDVKTSQLPAVILEKGDVLPSPSIAKLAQQLGFPSQATEEMYDVVIIGAGPAGLAAAVYGGSEGLKTLLVERRAPGGQAGSSSRIENYLGFPNGLSGQELTRRAVTQAKRFGIEFLAPAEVTNIGVSGEYKCLSLSDGQHVNAKSIIITTGVAYRHLTTTGVPDYTGAGVYYGSSMAEAQACSNQDVYIVGGGNSAGQAAVYLSRFAKSVNILIRRPDLTSSMSSYLIDQIAAIDTIQVHDHTVIEEARGADQRLTTLRLRHNQTEEIRDVHADALFIFIGSKPETNWIQLDLIKNDRGYIETGKSLMRYDEFKRSWKRDREPYNLETCIPGIFAAGDVRAGAMNRVASAVGEGSMAISHVHQYLAEI